MKTDVINRANKEEGGPQVVLQICTLNRMVSVKTLARLALRCPLCPLHHLRHPWSSRVSSHHNKIVHTLEQTQAIF